jgi:hypothetical protein
MTGRTAIAVIVSQSVREVRTRGAFNTRAQAAKLRTSQSLSVTLTSAPLSTATYAFQSVTFIITSESTVGKFDARHVRLADSGGTT